MTSPKERTDRQGESVLVDIYDQYSSPLFRYAYRLLGDGDRAEDCVAETFSRFLRTVKNSGKLPDNIHAYLYRTAHNWIMDIYRQNEPLELDSEAHFDIGTNPQHMVSRKMDQERVIQALVQLPEEQQQVIVLRFMEDLSHDQVSQVIGKTVEATRKIQQRAIVALRKLLAGQED